MAKIGVVGTGMVGASFAYSLLHTGLADELVLVDANTARAEGEAMDLGHAMPFLHPAVIREGTYPDLAGSEVVVICAGAAQKPGQTRLDLVGCNAAIFADMIPQIVAAAPRAVLVVATNPVDIMTLAALRFSGLPDHQVFGSGTILDTARFRYLLGRHFRVDARNTHALIIGEHGDTELAVWSGANIAGLPLTEYARQTGVPWTDQHKIEMLTAVRRAAYEIINRKGATYYAIGAGLMRIVEAIIRDQQTVLSVCSRLTGQNGVRDMCLSLPTVVGRGGVVRVLELALDAQELADFAHSASVLMELAAKTLPPPATTLPA